ncbi:hypothetical protein AYI68_g2032, partial [Smittium mucronatum]
MGEDFFRSPLKDEERKEAIYSFTKFMPMNYQPHPLNEAAPTTAKNMDSTLLGYQISLAEITRPLDQYVHNQLRGGRVLNESDEDIELINMTRM